LNAQPTDTKKEEAIEMLRPFRHQARRLLLTGLAMLAWFLLPGQNAWAQG
jgi:hypothetical protein